MSELTPEKVSAILNRRTGGFDCFVCGKCEWQMSASEEESAYLEVRCLHCGHIELFDREFVERELLSPEAVKMANPSEQTGYADCSNADRPVEKFFGCKGLRGLIHRFLG